MSERFFPFQALGLRCNPYRALTNEEWAALALLHPIVAAVLATGFTHLQILGQMGRGKTSALLGLTQHFAQSGLRVAYEYLPDGQSRFHTHAEELDLLLLDEAQRLSRGERQRLLQIAGRGVRLVCSSHSDLAALFKRRQLALTSVSLDGNDQAHMRAVLEGRLHYFALEGGPQLWLAPDALEQLWHLFGGNLRAAERLLYEVLQSLPPPGAITAEQIRAHAAASDQARSWLGLFGKQGT